MKPQYIRCMINSPYRYYDSETGTYDKTRNIASISRLLRYCTERGITVMYGEYNPPTWDMKQDQKWVDMSVDYLNYLVNDLGFSCIKYFVIFNEPDGNWASTNGDYEMWKQMLFRFHRKMKEYPGLTEKVMLAGPDVVADYKNQHHANTYNRPHPKQSFSPREHDVYSGKEFQDIVRYALHADPDKHGHRTIR